MQLRNQIKYLVLCFMINSCNCENDSLNDFFKGNVETILHEYSNNNVIMEHEFSINNIPDSILIIFTPVMCTKCKENLLSLLGECFAEQLDKISVVVYGVHQIRELYFWNFHGCSIYISQERNSDFEIGMGRKPVVLKKTKDGRVLGSYVYDKKKPYAINYENLMLFFK